MPGASKRVPVPALTERSCKPSPTSLRRRRRRRRRFVNIADTFERVSGCGVCDGGKRAAGTAADEGGVVLDERGSFACQLDCLLPHDVVARWLLHLFSAFRGRCRRNCTPTCVEGVHPATP